MSGGQDLVLRDNSTDALVVAEGDAETLSAIMKIDQANMAIERYFRTFEQIGDRLSLKSSQAIAAIVGGAGGATVATLLTSAAFGPVGMLIGSGAALLLWRGPRHMESDKSKRVLEENLAIIKSELEYLEKTGAPDRVVSQLWKHYSDLFEQHTETLLGLDSPRRSKSSFLGRFR